MDATKIGEAREQLWEDYLSLCDKYKDLLPVYEVGFALIQFNVKMLLDCAPRHLVAIDTVRAATESGIMWHVEDKQGRANHE